jgi:POT family proton-dependent oligopeptide transporter
MAIVDSAPQKTLFGHPRGLTWLFTTEMAERFSYYGMRAILVLYLVNFLLLPGQAENAIGYASIKHLFESLFNGGQPLAVQPFSSLIYGNYTAFVYLTPFFGGLIADRWIGQRYSVIIGGITMAAAEFTLMEPRLFFIGLLLLIIGNGFFKPNISTQVGGLYKDGDSRIDRAYSIFYVGINVGAFFSPLICGSLAEDPAYGFKWGFFAAGVGMVLGQIVYLLALRTLPKDRIARTKAGTETKAPLTSADWRAVLAIILLCLPTTLFWATYEQQGNTISLWAEQFTNRALIPGIVDWQIPVTWFQSFNPFMIFAFTPVIVWLWGRQSARGKEPATVTKMALGNLLLAGSYLIMAAAAYLTGPTGHASWLWLFAFFMVITLGAADPVDDDGAVVHHQLHRQSSAGVYRQLLQPHGQGELLPALRRSRPARGAGHLGVRASAALDHRRQDGEEAECRGRAAGRRSARGALSTACHPRRAAKREAGVTGVLSDPESGSKRACSVRAWAR